MLWEFLLSGGVDVALQVKEYGSGTGSSLIDRKDVLAHNVFDLAFLFFRIFTFLNINAKWFSLKTHILQFALFKKAA